MANILQRNIIMFIISCQGYSVKGDIWEPPAKRCSITSPPPVAAVCNKQRWPHGRKEKTSCNDVIKKKKK